MKYQRKISKEVLKENKIWWIFFLLLALLKIILFYLEKEIVPIPENALEMLLGVTNFNDWLTILLFIYQITLTILLVYHHTIYEEKNSYEFIHLRVKKSKWWIEKWLNINGMIILYRFIYGSFCYVFLIPYSNIKTIFGKNLFYFIILANLFFFFLTICHWIKNKILKI